MVKAAQGLRQLKSDLFHDNVPHKFILRVWRVMQDTPRHTYQILTKRPERMAEILSGWEFHVLPNVWLGRSVEDDRVLDRLDAIRAVPAAIRFVSFEPLIGSAFFLNNGAVRTRRLPVAS